MTAVVTLHVWRVPSRRLPAVGWRMATDRGRLRRLPGVRFAKLLGTAGQFGPGSADATRWAAVLAWDSADAAAGFETSTTARRWRAIASGYCRLDLRVLSSRGTWAGRRPFTPTDQLAQPVPAQPVLAQPALAQPVLALTRARLRPTRAWAFWRALHAPAQAVRQAPGLLATFGIGEAPLGWQGTVSLWRGVGDLVEFAYRDPDHRRVVDETPGRQWYAEELFARFAVVAVTGDHDVIGWCAEEDGSVQAQRSTRQ